MYSNVVDVEPYPTSSPTMSSQQNGADNVGHQENGESNENDVVIQLDLQLVDDVVELASNLPLEDQQRRRAVVVNTIANVPRGAQ
jgi:hypothetical protein